jgi:small subunit ribosomal protein S20
MPNTKSAKKRHRQSLERRTRNRAVKSAVKSQIRKARESVKDNNAEQTQTEFRLAVKKLDQAAAKGVLHRNTAARLKSRLNARLKAARST